MRRTVLAALLAALFAFPALAAAPSAPDGAAILKTVDRNLEPESYESFRKLINIEPDGSHKDYVLYTVKKGSDKLVALFLSPASEAGRGTLRLGDNMWLYIPEVGRPIRITSLQSVVGGVFNNADIRSLDYSVEYNVAKLEATADTYVLTLKAKTDAVAYDRLVMRVNRADLLPTEIACYAASGILVKTLRFSDVKDFGGGIRRPAEITTDSPLYKGYKSVMIFAGLKARIFPDEVFTLSFLPKVGTLRPQ